MRKEKHLLNNPYFLMFCFSIFGGSFAAVSKLVLKTVDNFQMLFYIFGSASLFITIILAATKKLKMLKNLKMRDYIKLLGFGLPSFMYFLCYLLSLKLIPAVEASMLNYLYPIIMVILAVLFIREKLNLFKILALLSGFIGTAVIIIKGDIGNINFTNLGGDLLGIGAASSWAVFSILGKKNKLDPYLSIFIYTLEGFILSILTLFLFSGYIMPDALAFSGLIWIGITSIAGVYFVWFRALKLSSPTFVAGMSYFNPFLSLLFIFLLLGEKILFIQIIGLVFVVLGIIFQRLDQQYEVNRETRQNI
jgi:drug/metabolite transporter (DMT)-like permease